MDKTKYFSSVSLKAISCFLLLFLTNNWFLQAQSTMIADGIIHRVYAGEDPAHGDNSWHYETLIVPEDTKKKYLYLVLRGADGGNRKYNDGISIDFNVGGGEGALIKARFKIGYKPNQIPPGSVLRFLVGKRGKERGGYNARGAEGGGGTGVFVKQVGSNYWKVLAVAGGGGGAHADCCTRRYKGRPGETNENGSYGGGSKAPSRNEGGYNGSNGYSGETPSSDSSHGGGGIWSAWPDGRNDKTKQPTGGKEKVPGYQFGCGFGGNTYHHAGGGGGYSGGGVGNLEGPGGGGGSFVNTDMADNIEKKKNSHTTNPIDGYVKYQFFDNPNITINNFSFLDNFKLAVDGSSASGLYFTEKINGFTLPKIKMPAEGLSSAMMYPDMDIHLAFVDKDAPSQLYSKHYSAYFMSNGHGMVVSEEAVVTKPMDDGTNKWEASTKYFTNSKPVFKLYMKAGTNGTYVPIPPNEIEIEIENGNLIFSSLDSGRQYKVEIAFNEDSSNIRKTLTFSTE